MGTCEVCGNEYDKAFTVITAEGEEHTFDSFECAIHAIAPACVHCNCRIIGHGIDDGENMYCCASCAKHMEAHAFADRS
jgi:hypothetical protein